MNLTNTKIYFILLLLITQFEVKAIRDTSDIIDNQIKLARIDSLSKSLVSRLKPTYNHLSGNDEIMYFSENQITVTDLEFLNNAKLLESEIPLQYNEEVKKLINYFATSWQVRLKDMVTVSKYYFPIYEETFDKYNMPLEFKYLSIIESALNPYAYSRSGASGLWQFMSATGKIFSLDVNSNVDERRNIEKSTDAACQYLKRMYKIYGDWLLVIASYNAGPGNVNKAIRNSGGKRTFWEILPYLPKETQRYVPSFIAMAYIMNFHERYGISPGIVETPRTHLVAIRCNSSYSFKAISEALNISEDDIRIYNPELKKSIIPKNDAFFGLNLPYDYAMKFIELEDSISLASNRKPEKIVIITEEINENVTVKKTDSKTKIYKVKKGESLPAISKKLEVSLWQLKSLNGLKSNKIYPGQKLKYKS